MEKFIEKNQSDTTPVWKVLEHYIPDILREKLGKNTIVTLLGKENLQPYRDAIITKKVASMAFYRFGERWGEYLREIEGELLRSLHRIFVT